MTQEVQESITNFLHLLIDPLTSEFEVKIEREGDQWRVSLLVSNPENVIGEEGEILRSIQHILRVLVHRKNIEDRSHFLLDINNYRREREAAVSSKIPEIAQNEVLTQGNTVILVGLSGYERLQVHRILADIKGLNTSSVGPEDNRKLLIMPTSETGSTSMDKAKIININQIK